MEEEKDQLIKRVERLRKRVSPKIYIILFKYMYNIYIFS